MMVRWAVTADAATSALLDTLCKIPLAQRKHDNRVIQIVRNMKAQWLRGTKIERLATLGWTESESIDIFCNMLDKLGELRQTFAEELQKSGPLPALCDEDVEKYERASEAERKTF